MNSSSEISRRDFLKIVPHYLAESVHAFTGQFSKPAETDTQATVVETVDEHCARIARIDTNRCLAWDGGSCQFCYLACPLRDTAIIIEDQQPIINPAVCDGCAKCASACQTVNSKSAIEMVVVE